MAKPSACLLSKIRPVRAMPGASGESVLYRILSTDESAGWRYDHSVEIPDSKRLDVIKNWIDSGCPR